MVLLRASVLALTLAAAPLGARGADGFVMVSPEVGVVVTGMEGVPPGTAKAIIAGFVEGLGDGGGYDFLNVQKVLVVRGYPTAIGGAAPGLVVDWRVSLDGGPELGTVFSAIPTGGAGWDDIDPDDAAEIGRQAADRFIEAGFTGADLTGADQTGAGD